MGKTTATKRKTAKTKTTEGPWVVDIEEGEAGIFHEATGAHLATIAVDVGEKESLFNGLLMAASPDLKSSLDPRTLQCIAEELESGSYNRIGGAERLAHAVECLRAQAKAQFAAIAKTETYRG